jgi:DNA-directed RNA polymerase subunit RPC12/RpoP
MKNEPDEIHFDWPKCKRPMVGDRALLGELINCPDCGEAFFPTPRKPAPPPAEPKLGLECPRCHKTFFADKQIRPHEFVTCPDCGSAFSPLDTPQDALTSKSGEWPKMPPIPEPPISGARLEGFKIEVVNHPRILPLQIDTPTTSTALNAFAIFELIASPIAALAVGTAPEGKPVVGWIVFLSGVISGLILLGFSQIVRHTHESAKRLLEIEQFMRQTRFDEITERQKNERGKQNHQI